MSSATNITIGVGSSDAEDAEAALYRLEEIDKLLNMDVGDDQAIFAKYLSSGSDLKTALQTHDEELTGLCDRCIQDHVDQADSICALYNDFTSCEGRLVDFEEEIVNFQRKLADTADDIVKMQQQTDELVRSVTHRRQVSNKINEVYSALQECDSFCDDIVNKAVDRTYLMNLRELVRKLAFLSRNKELQNSAVDNEIRPKLTAAAYKAGDKLQRFLSKKIASLAEDSTNIELQQQSLEQSGQFAFTFLLRYNPVVAKAITNSYIQVMSDIFYRQFRTFLRSLSEASALHANPLEPIVTAEETHGIMCNRDSTSPPGDQINLPEPRFPARVLAYRERSVSQHMRGFADLMGRAELAHVPRAATFEDTVLAVNSLNVRYGKLQLDPACCAKLDECNSWTWQLVRCFAAVVNTCVSECRFIGNFFCVAEDVEGGENYDDAEKIARGVLGRAVAAVESSIQEDLPLVMDRAAVLAGLRVVEFVKEYLCTSLDPIPLLLLSSTMEIAKGCLKSNSRVAMQNDLAALSFLPTVKLRGFNSAPPDRATLAQILSNKAYCATLGPHPAVTRVWDVIGQLELLNTAPFRGSSVNAVGSRPYDATLSTQLHSALVSTLEFVQLLARRHPSTLAQSIFITTNIFIALALWRLIAQRNPIMKEVSGNAPQSRTANSPLRTKDEDGELSLSSPLAAGRSPSPAPSTSFAYLGVEAHVHLLESRLANAVARFVEVDAAANGTFNYLFTFVETAVDRLGEDYFSEKSTVAAVLPNTLPGALSSARTQEVAVTFNANWQAQLDAIVTNTRKLVKCTIDIPSQSARTATVVKQWCKDLEHIILRDYLQAVVDANAKFFTFATKMYDRNNDLQAKLVSNVTVLHEVQKSLSN